MILATGKSKYFEEIPNICFPTFMKIKWIFIREYYFILQNMFIPRN